MTDASPGRFLILHGYENHRPEGHWQRWLAGELEASGAVVAYPQLPDPDAPVVSEWLGALERELDALDRQADAGPLTVVAHSLACLLWLRFADEASAAGAGPVADRLLLVAPPSNEILAAEPALAPFVTAIPSGAPGAAGVAARQALVVASDNDPYSPRGAEAEWARPLGIPFSSVAGAGHITIPDGYGPWPAALAWCLGAR